jgi:hypothetical protein
MRSGQSCEVVAVTRKVRFPEWLPPAAKPPLDLNKAIMDRYRPEMRKFYLGEQLRLF